MTFSWGGWRPISVNLRAPASPGAALAATAFSPRRKPWEPRRLQKGVKPRKGRHQRASGRCPMLPAGLCRPYRGLRSRFSSLFSHGFRRGLDDAARASGLSGISDS